MSKEQFVDIQTGKVTVQDAKDITYTAPKVDNVLPQLRRIRNGILAQSDWIVIKEREEGGSASNFADWKKYRQELRDITKTYKTLDDVKWPIKPS